MAASAVDMYSIYSYMAEIGPIRSVWALRALDRPMH